jgi:hypothetical protein
MGLTPLIKELNRADCGCQVLGAERKFLMNMNDLKLEVRNFSIGVVSASKRNMDQEYILGVKGAGV